MEIVKWNSILDSFFDDETLSVHFKEKTYLLTKKWRPGNWMSVKWNDIITKDFLDNLIWKLFDEVKYLDEWFLEIDRKYSKVLQIWPYRIVIVLPPLSNVMEMTVVKPIMKLTIEDYNLDEQILDLLKNQSKWILISWAPWEWKTTFAQALSQLYVEDEKIVKTIESPRDLLVWEEVTQYSFSYWTHWEIRDILLLSRPDFTIYDEVRNADDFLLFKDLRLTWIGLIWVIHATNPVDSIQRLIWTIEMWVIPQVVDTVVFIKKWWIDKILNLDQVVKVPHWMESWDLARPVVLIKEFPSQQVLYEIYSYWEQIVVMPLSKIDEKDWKEKTPKLIEYWIKYIKDYFAKEFKFPVDIESEWWNWIKILVSDKNKWQVIWKAWTIIQAYEKKLWVSISVREKEENKKNHLSDNDSNKPTVIKEKLDTDKSVKVIKKQKGDKQILILDFGKPKRNSNVEAFIWTEIFCFYTDNDWQVVVKKSKLQNLIESEWIKSV